MDFVRYADRSAGLVNADLEDATHLIEFLDVRLQPHLFGRSRLIVPR